jgi:cytochrome c oxidase assembly protein subunit 23
MSSQSSQADQQQQSSQPGQPNAWEKAERKFANKHASEYYDPCQDFADRSLKCMKRNAFDKDMCGDYFQYVYSILSCKSVLVFSFVGLHELICFLKEPIVTAKRNG